jgi:hypothetical protein
MVLDKCDGAWLESVPMKVHRPKSLVPAALVFPDSFLDVAADLSVDVLRRFPAVSRFGANPGVCE